MRVGFGVPLVVVVLSTAATMMPAGVQAAMPGASWIKKASRGVGSKKMHGKSEASSPEQPEVSNLTTVVIKRFYYTGR